MALRQRFDRLLAVTTEPRVSPVSWPALAITVTLMLAGVIGAQYGVRVGQRLRGEQLRALLGLLVLAVGLRLAVALVVTPEDIYSVVMGMGN